MSCKEGQHNLIVIYQCNKGSGTSEVVRWCDQCGSVVVDLDYDGRTNPGAIMKMKAIKK